MSAHAEARGLDNHAINANPNITGAGYTDIAARDADTTFQVAANIDKVVRVDSPLSFWVLTSVGPTVWVEFSNTSTDSFIEHPDTFSSFTGEAGKILQVNSGENAVETGQQLRITDNPQFADLTLTGDLIVQGTTTTIESATLTVEDKNIEIGKVASPTDVTADGGGITLKGTTDKTLNWINATNAWSFNQNIDLLGSNLLTSGGNVLAGSGLISVGNLQLFGNLLSSNSGDLDVTTQTGGIFKFVDNAFQAGLDATNYLEIGHGGSNSFINQVGAGGMDFRFAGTTKATFTAAGHLHLLTDTDQKHNLKIITSNNLNDTGIAWENSGGSFTHTIFRTDVGSNRADLVFAAGLNTDIDLLTNSFKIHGEAADEGKLEVLGEFQISSGNPGLNKVLTSDANGIANWTLPQTQGWTDAGADVILTNINDNVGIGESGPDSKLHVTAGSSAGTVTAATNSIATFEKGTNGFISVLTPDANEKGIIFGGPISNLDGGVIYNTGGLRGMEFRVNGNSTKMIITSAGDVGIGTTSPNAELDIRGPGGQSVGGFPSGALHVTSTSALEFRNAVITGHNLFGGNTQLWYLGSTSSSNNNIALINRQNAELHLHTNDLNRFTIQAGGNVGIAQTNPTEKLDVTGNIKFTGNLITSNNVSTRGGGSAYHSVTFLVGTTYVALPFDTTSDLINVELVGGLGGTEWKSLIDQELKFSFEPQVNRPSGGASESIVVQYETSTDDGVTWTKGEAIFVELKGGDSVVSPLTASLHGKDDRIRFMAQATTASTIEFIAIAAGTITSEQAIIPAYILNIH